MPRIAIFEDEPMIQLLWEDLVDGLGFEIAGVCQSLEEGERMAATAPIDLAILDVNIGGKDSDCILDLLESRKIPVVVCSGLTSADVPVRFQQHERLDKPFTAMGASRVLCKMLNKDEELVSHSGGSAPSLTE